jgi:hypothetical protein
MIKRRKERIARASFIREIFFLLFISNQLIKYADSVILTPPYFNLVSNKRVIATATCGEDVNEPELYCKLTGSTATDRETSNYANLIQVETKNNNKNHILIYLNKSYYLTF